MFILKCLYQTNNIDFKIKDKIIKIKNLLNKLKNLKYIELQFNQIVNVKPLSKLKNLIRLELEGNKISNF
jgi:Leucine-rich repeat (LRR) protein